MTAILFIDANQYLDLFGLVAGKKLLGFLEEQKQHIFVSKQIGAEVLRRKLDCARMFFSRFFEELATLKIPIPDHLLGITDEKTEEFRGILKAAERVRTELIGISVEGLSKISQSEDDVSKQLKMLFEKAVMPTQEEIERARERKERGNPPGKSNDPLGDQITWEQLLTCCHTNKVRKVWIISRDQDYVVTYHNSVLLNPFLRNDLAEKCGNELEVYCFSDLLRGIKDFANNAGVTSKKLPSEEEAAVIEKEIKALPPRAWNAMFDDANLIAAWMAQRQRAFRAAIASDPGKAPPLPLNNKG
jgi:hypothetical protein